MIGAPVFRYVLTPGWAGDSLARAAQAVPSLDLNFAVTKTVGPLVTFTRASSATYVGSDGLIKTATTNEPRFDHNPTTGESLGLLVEEQRTNLLLRSEEFDNASWTPTALQAFGSGSSANAIASPSGSITADLITENTANSEHNALQAITVTVNTVYTLSCFAKKGTRSILAMSPTSPGVANYYTLFNLDTGAIVFNEAGNTSTITALGNGWYRCSITRTTGAAQVLSNNKIGIANNVLSTTYTGDGASGIYVWGAQLEAGAFPTSYIPTTTAAATRSADVASITGANFSSWYRQDEGTVFAEASTYLGTAAVSRGLWSIESDGNNTHRFIRQSDQQPVSQTLAGGVSQTTFGFGANWNTAANRKLSYAYAVNNFASTVDNLAIQTDTSGSLPSPTTLNIGNTSGGSHFGGTIRRLTYWPQRLPDSTLQAITQ